MKVWRHQYTVTGKRASRFPIDMLRYDASWPVHEEECHAIARSQDLQNLDDGIEPFQVTLVHYDSRNSWAPTYRRWESFGWTVVTHETTKREW